MASDLPITEWLQLAREGDSDANTQLWNAIYDQVLLLAKSAMAREYRPYSIVATELANEAYLKLAAGDPIPFVNRNHLMATIARALRRILVDHARKRGAEKRGGRDRTISLEQAYDSLQWHSPEWLDLDDALSALESEDSRLAKLVELRFFLGMTLEETAKHLDVSVRTAANDWAYARAFLRKYLEEPS